METPSGLEAAADNDDEITISNREYEDESIIAVDFGPLDGVPSIDVVGDTVIVTVDDEQFEFDLPAGASDVTVNDDILTING